MIGPAALPIEPPLPGPARIYPTAPASAGLVGGLWIRRERREKTVGLGNAELIGGLVGLVLFQVVAGLVGAVYPEYLGALGIALIALGVIAFLVAEWISLRVVIEAGLFWFLVCVIFPIANIYFLVTRWHRLREATFLSIAGVLLVPQGVVLLAMGEPGFRAALGRVVEGDEDGGESGADPGEPGSEGGPEITGPGDGSGPQDDPEPGPSFRPEIPRPKFQPRFGPRPGPNPDEARPGFPGHSPGPRNRNWPVLDSVLRPGSGIATSRDSGAG